MIRNRSSGFTLVELIVVILLLGVIMSVVLPRLPGLTGAERAKAIRQLAFSAQSLHEHAAFKKKV